MNPTSISVGDIVEARLSFLVVPVAGGYKNDVSKDFRLVIVLRSLALIDNTFTKVVIHFSLSIVIPIVNILLESCTCTSTSIVSEAQSFKDIKEECGLF
jgi:hypothetical protein